MVTMLDRPKLLINLAINISVIVFMYIIGWLVFVRNEKYKIIIARYKNTKKSTLKFSIFINIAMTSVLFISIAMRVIGVG